MVANVMPLESVRIDADSSVAGRGPQHMKPLGSIVLLLVCAPEFGQPALGALPTNEAEFRQQYLPRLAALEEFHASFEAAAEGEKKFTAWPRARYQRINFYCALEKASYQSQFEEYLPADVVMTSTDSFPRAGERRVASVAPGAAFQLKRDADAPDYQIQSVGESRKSVVQGYIDTTSKPVFLCSFYPGVSMRDLLGDPTVRIRSVEKNAGNGHVVVTFENQGHDPWWQELRVEFAPELEWRISAWSRIQDNVGQAGVENPQRAVMDYSCTYDVRADGIYPKAVSSRGTLSTRYRDETQTHQSEETYRIVRFERKPIADSQFLLSAFGIPDAVLAEDGGGAARNPLARYLIISIVVLAALVLACVWVRRRSNMT